MKYVLLAGQKIFIVAFMLALSFVCVTPAIAQEKNALPLKPHVKGSLVMDNGTIYVIGTGQKRGFRSMNEFLTYNYRTSRIVRANEGDKALPEGPVMRAKPGTVVLDPIDKKTVYVVGKNEEKQWVSTAKALKRIMKSAKRMWNIDVSDYPVGVEIKK